MVAFILPITWAFTGAVSLGVLNRVGSWLGLTGLAVDDLKLRKANELGVDPESISQILTPNEARRLRLLVENGLYRHMGVKHVFVLDDDFVRRHKLDGEYCLFDGELMQLLDGLRHLELVEGVGVHPDKLRKLIEGTGLAYEDFSFMWEGWDCDFAKLRKLSKERLSNPDWTDAATWLMERRVSKV